MTRFQWKKNNLLFFIRENFELNIRIITISKTLNLF